MLLFSDEEVEQDGEDGSYESKQEIEVEPMELIHDDNANPTFEPVAAAMVVDTGDSSVDDSVPDSLANLFEGEDLDILYMSRNEYNAMWEAESANRCFTNNRTHTET